MSAEEVIEKHALFDTNTFPLRDPNFFVAGQLHQCVDEWHVILDKNSNETSDDVKSWIQNGVDVHDFFTHCHGNFNGKSYCSQGWKF